MWRVMANALWVRLNVKREIGKCIPHPSFYPGPNISDRFSPPSLPFYQRPNISD